MISDINSVAPHNKKRIYAQADRTGESQAFSFKYETGRFEFYEDEDDE